MEMFTNFALYGDISNGMFDVIESIVQGLFNTQ